MDPVRVGVVGCGYWGPNLIRNMLDLPSATLVGVADRDQQRLAFLRASHPHVARVANHRDLLRLGVDAIVIATPPATHYAIAKECLEAGANVLVEKPMALTSIDAEDLVEIAERKGLTLMAGHTFEYNAAVRALKSIIDSGELGRIYYVNAVRVNLGLFQRGLNVLWDLAPHDVSILLYLLGSEPTHVSAQGAASIFPGMHDLAYVHMTFPNDIIAHIHVSWLDPCKVRRITVVGSRKMVVYDDIEATEKIRIYDRGVETPCNGDSVTDFQCSYRWGDIVIPNIRFTEPLKVECQHFIDCVINGHVPQSNGRVGLKVVRILEAADRSLQNGGGKESPFANYYSWPDRVTV
ncbi:MAG: Gfo/Idh/MocA family protein [Anaerolineae bacterium]